MKLKVVDNNGAKLSVNGNDSANIKAGDVIDLGTKSYDQLTDKPKIEGFEIAGDVSLDDINAYSQDTINDLLSDKVNADELAEVATSGSYNDLEDKPTIPVVPTKLSAFENDPGFITGYIETDPTVPSWAKSQDKPTYTADEVGALPDSTEIPSNTSDLVNDSDFTTKTYSDEQDAAIRGTLFYGVVDDTSTSTVFTATIPGITEYRDGLAVVLENGVVTSASGFTLNINGLGALPSYSNMTRWTADTTIFNVSYTMLFIYRSTLNSGAGGWICYRGYDANTNTIGYQIRTNSLSLPMANVTYRYRILFTSADGTKFVPANASSSTNATASRSVCQTPIDPFGRIVYYGTTASVAAGSRPAAANLWQQYTCTFGYSFNRTGAALTLTPWAPIYIKCAPQADGSAIMDSTTPYVQALPTSNDGNIYIFIGIAYSATSVEITLEHPVYWHDGTGIRRWTGAVI